MFYRTGSAPIFELELEIESSLFRGGDRGGFRAIQYWTRCGHALMSTRHSIQSETDTFDEQDSRTVFERISYEHTSSDSDSNCNAPTPSPSNSTSLLVQRVRSAGSWTVPVLMLGTYLAAVVFIVVHHIFLSVLEGEDVKDFAVPQSWVRDIGNALARVVQISLETSVGVALAQSVSTGLPFSTSGSHHSTT